MARNYKIEQERFHSSCFRHDDLPDRISAQWALLYGIEIACRDEDQDRLRGKVEHLEADLIRGALTLLQQQLDDVVLKDGATLITNRLFDTTAKQSSQQDLIKWLEAGAYWRMILTNSWLNVLSSTEEQVFARLAEDGVAVSPDAKNELRSVVRSLVIADLMPAKDYGRLFETKPESDANDVAGESEF